MMQQAKTQGTILIYTLVLVMLTVFMALATFNLTQKLEADYRFRQLDMSFMQVIHHQAHLIFKYAHELNTS